MPADPVQPYTSYLLHVWRVWEQDGMACRVLLESTATGQRWGFNNIPDLLTFLEARTSESVGAVSASQIAVIFIESSITSLVRTTLNCPVRQNLLQELPG